jgi:hypothetical protein
MRTDAGIAMPIVDAQVHVWSQGTPSGQHRQISSYSAEDYLKEMDEAGVNAAVPRSRAGHGPRGVRLDRLEIAGVRNRLRQKGGKTLC